jgi:hypothetical protein
LDRLKLVTSAYQIDVNNNGSVAAMAVANVKLTATKNLE